MDSSTVCASRVTAIRCERVQELARWYATSTPQLHIVAILYNELARVLMGRGIFTGQRSASAVHAVVVVRLSVCTCHTPVLYRNG